MSDEPVTDTRRCLGRNFTLRRLAPTSAGSSKVISTSLSVCVQVYSPGIPGNQQRICMIMHCNQNTYDSLWLCIAIKTRIRRRRTIRRGTLFVHIDSMEFEAYLTRCQVGPFRLCQRWARPLCEIAGHQNSRYVRGHLWHGHEQYTLNLVASHAVCISCAGLSVRRGQQRTRDERTIITDMSVDSHEVGRQGRMHIRCNATSLFWILSTIAKAGSSNR